MPASKEEIDHVYVEESPAGNKVTVLSYGLPLMFWGYFAILITLELAMYLSISSMLFKMLQSKNNVDTLISYVCIATMIIIPVFALMMLFFRKAIISSTNNLIIEFRFFGLVAWRKSYQFKRDRDYLEVTHLLESPNMAKIRKSPNTRAFENQGHFILTLWSDGKPYFIDRHTRKQDLIKLSKLIGEIS